MANDWKHRAARFIQRFWQPTCACMTCMPGSWSQVMSLAHWTIALRTGLFTGLLAVLVTFTPARKLYTNRYGNAAVVAVLSMLGDAYSHASRYRVPYLEHVLTGAIAGVLALIASYVFEDRAVRVRRALDRVLHCRAH